MSRWYVKTHPFSDPDLEKLIRLPTLSGRSLRSYSSRWTTMAFTWSQTCSAISRYVFAVLPPSFAPRSPAGVLQGIYPTGIIVLVCLNMTFHDDVSRAEKMVSTMQCEPQSGGYGPQSSGGSYGTVLHLRKEGASRAGTGMGSGTGTGTGTGTRRSAWTRC